MAISSSSSRLSSELSTADLGDTRLVRRLQGLVERLERAPELSFPKQLNAAELEAGYRFLGNERVTPTGILTPHIAATHQRARDEGGDVLAVHDTSLFAFNGEGDRGLGPLKTKKVGFLGHVTLAVSADGERRPLGVVALTTIIRPAAKTQPRPPKGGRWKPRDDAESARWWAHVKSLSEPLHQGYSTPSKQWIHLMDREADDYALFARLIAGGHRFVIRLSHDRRLESPEREALEKLHDVLAMVRARVERTVLLSRRTPKTPRETSIHPKRNERTAKLVIGAATVCFKRPRTQAETLAPTVEAHVVHVWEPAPPKGDDPVEWSLLTTEPIATTEQLLRIVDFYRARWVIEEYFKALKTGCSYESRQLESAHSLLNALALFAPIAWQLLALRSSARSFPSRPATSLMSATTIAVLVHFSRIAIPPRPTVQQAMLAIAALGGHLKHNGEPGWQTLWAGYTKLLTLEEGWQAGGGM